VHRHVFEDAAPAFDVLGRRWGRVTAAKFDGDNIADFAFGDGLLDTCEVRVETALQGREKLNLATTVEGLCPQTHTYHAY